MFLHDVVHVKLMLFPSQCFTVACPWALNVNVLPVNFYTIEIWYDIAARQADTQ